MEFATETRATRYLMEAPSMYRVEGDKTWHRGRTMNISESGVLLQAAGQLALQRARHASSTESIPYPVAALPSASTPAENCMKSRFITRSTRYIREIPRCIES